MNIFKKTELFLRIMMRNLGFMEPNIRKLLQGSNEKVTSSALEKMRNSNSVVLLINVLSDRSQTITARKSAVKTLGVMGDKTAVEALIDCLEDEDREFKNAVISALGEIRDERSVIPLMMALRCEHTSSEAAFALQKLGDISESYLLNELENHKLNIVESDLIGVLGSIHSKKSVEVLCKRLENPQLYYCYDGAKQKSPPDLAVRIESYEEIVIRALARIKDNRATPTLIKYLNNSHFYVRLEAAKAFQWIIDKRAVEPLIELLKIGDVYLQSETIQALVHQRDKKAYENILGILKNARSYSWILSEQDLVEEAIAAIIIFSEDKLFRIDERLFCVLSRVINRPQSAWAIRKTAQIIRKLKDSNTLKMVISDLNGRYKYPSDFAKQLEEITGVVFIKNYIDSALKTVESKMSYRMSLAIDRIQEPIIADNLISAWENSNEVSNSITELLIEIRGKRITDFLVSLLHKPQYVSFAIESLVQIGGYSVVDPLIDVLRNDNASIAHKTESLEGLKKLSQEMWWVKDRLKNFISSNKVDSKLLKIVKIQLK